MNSTVYSRVKAQGTAHAIQKRVCSADKQAAGSLQNLLLYSISPEQRTFLHM